MSDKIQCLEYQKWKNLTMNGLIVSGSLENGHLNFWDPIELKNIFTYKDVHAKQINAITTCKTQNNFIFTGSEYACNYIFNLSN